MRPMQTFQVFPAVPESISFVETVSRNLWWSWQHDAKEVFRRANPELWQKSRENPLAFATMISQEQLQSLSRDPSFLAHLERIRARYEEQVLAPVDRSGTPFANNEIIAYFSMEFGIHESLPIFAGGLGVLAGDHMKAASDLALPLAGVGILFRRGYFHQFLNHEGWQQEEYPETNLYYLPLGRVRDQEGNELFVKVNGPEGEIFLAVWKVGVGRVPLFLLDANVHQNSPEIRNVTARLYASEGKTRMLQEIILGIGGMKALLAMGYIPKVVHMNEGHCAFASIERIAYCMESHGVDLSTAMECIPRTQVFTTHTPVPAGHDEFPADMVRPCLAPFAHRIGVSVEEILSWGQPPGSGPHGPLSMFVLALRMSQYINGVSRLHGQVARRMWAHVWPGIPEQEVPIHHITNGVHVSSWVSPENALLFDLYLGPDWHLRPSDEEVVSRVDSIYDGELWRAHEMSRSRLIRSCREAMIHQYGRRNAPKGIMQAASTVLDQDVLTIGFARRFATYKRAYLLFMQPERLEAIIRNVDRPVQFIFAGKAHPKDNEGKGLIKQIVEFAQNHPVRRNLIFLEDYDIHIARYLVQGVDVWLNTPRRPMEASGTSGMKAALNGVLNLSIMDGWWDEAYRPDLGFAIGKGEVYEDWAYQDATESQALYNLLENDVIPAFYERANSDLPSRWVSMMKEAIKVAMRQFSAHHMVSGYYENFYEPAGKRMCELLDNQGEHARGLVSQRARLYAHWGQIRVEQPQREGEGFLRVGQTFRVNCLVHLGYLSTSEVEVHLYYGPIKTLDLLAESLVETMSVEEDLGNGAYVYGATVTCAVAGRYGFTARVMPSGDDWLRFAPGLITWA